MSSITNIYYIPRTQEMINNINKPPPNWDKHVPWFSAKFPIFSDKECNKLIGFHDTSQNKKFYFNDVSIDDIK